MKLDSPQDLVDAFFTAFNNSDIEAVLDLYEEQALFVGEPGQAARGADEIRKALEGFLGLKPTLTLVKNELLTAGDLTLSLAHWKLHGTSPDGEPVKMEATTSDVLRKQPDGTWRFAIDNPWGAALLR